MMRVDESLRERYLANAPVPKLHIGGGVRRLDGWLNTDIELLPGVMQMDATQPFPFVDAVFNYVFTEHMIEHLPFEGAVLMLNECHRVIKTGGVIRVTTPNLHSFVGLYGKTLSHLQHDYMNWFCKVVLSPDCAATPANAINAMFRQWGHQFIYDEDTLTNALRKAGFGEIRRYSLMQSEQQELRNLENVERYPEGFLDFESLALEARK
jgi:predicted SAM-dependent methyltransferase